MTYDSLPYNLLIAKLEVYGVNNEALCLMENYLENRTQRKNRFLMQFSA